MERVGEGGRGAGYYNYTKQGICANNKQQHSWYQHSENNIHMLGHKSGFYLSCRRRWILCKWFCMTNGEQVNTINTYYNQGSNSKRVDGRNKSYWLACFSSWLATYFEVNLQTRLQYSQHTDQIWNVLVETVLLKNCCWF